MTFNDAVKTLGLSVSASKKDIRDAYRQLVVKNHPDKFQDEIDKQVAEKNFKRIQEAYDFLMELKPAINVEDRMTRSGYDKDSDAVKNSLDELLKMRPMDEESFSWSGVSSTQGKVLKYIVGAGLLWVISMVIFFNWSKIRKLFE